MGRFETDGAAGQKWLQPVAVPTNKDDVLGAVRELLDDLDGWNVASVDEESRVVIVTKENGFLGGTSTITIRVDGPDGIPSSETHVVSESDGLISRDKKNVSTFCRMLYMRTT